MTTDAELLERSSHDSRAFRELYERYAERIHAFHRSRTGDAEAALDLTAETFAQAWEHRSGFTDERQGSCGPWLFGIARNLLLRSVRDGRLAREASRKLHLNLRETQVVPGPEWIDGLDDALEAALATALGGLPPGQYLAVTRRVLHDESYDGIARELDCSPVAARIRVSRGLAALRTALTPERNS
jgi:RNA polymerase sigma-70 factor (ECF subfamily)